MSTDAFPYTVTDDVTKRPLSASMRRSFERYPAYRPEDNPLFTAFKYTPLEGFDYAGGNGTVSRRDASKIICENGKFYVWYTQRQTPHAPVGMGRAKEATDAIPSSDWDLAEIWYATSEDGFRWTEHGPAFERPAKPAPGWRSVSTPDILKWKGRFYLYFQAFTEPSGLRGDYCPVSVAHADSPDGPWTIHEGEVLPTGEAGAWDQFAVHDPHPLVHDGKVYVYYKSAFGRPDVLTLGQGLAIADDPLGPFERHSLNPLMMSGHETALFPFNKGLAALTIRDGNEHYTVQYAEDWVNFDIASIVEFPPTAAGFFDPDAFTDSGNGRGVSWGLCHFVNAGGPGRQHSMLARFDCDLRQEVTDPVMKSTKYLHKPSAYFDQPLPHDVRETRASNATPDPVGVNPERQAAPTGGPFPYALVSGLGDRPVSRALRRTFEQYPAARPEENPLFSAFKYTPLEGLDYSDGDGTVSRRDPSKIIFENGRYYVWYTKRHTASPPLGMAGAADATDTVASADWDLADIWYATSTDGFTWQEQGVAVARPPKPDVGWRSVCTPDILKWNGRFYLYYQSFVEPSGLRGDYCPIGVAHADSPDGPWTRVDGVVLPEGKPGEWDQYAVHGPCMLVHDGKIHCYYKSAFNRPDKLWVALGLAIAEDPLGPFEKHPLNPVLNSGHETSLFPFKDGLAALLIQDGAEHYTVQFAKDWVSFEIASIVELAPTAAKFFDADAFADSGDGPGVSWGLCHFVNAGETKRSHSILARFDCDLRAQVTDPALKDTHYLHRPETYFGQPLTPQQRHRAEAEAAAWRNR